MGSGTTAKMSVLMGKNFIGSEISEDYFRISMKRLETMIFEREL
jgi:DNA modification methylase